MDKFIYSAIASELNDIKNLHGKPRREALQRLDNIVTRLFPPVEGSPLPSEELNGVADVIAIYQLERCFPLLIGVGRYRSGKL